MKRIIDLGANDLLLHVYPNGELNTVYCDIMNYKSPYDNTKLAMEIFQPSIYIAMFPYVFIASFPIFGIVLVTRWVLGDRRRKRPVT